MFKFADLDKEICLTCQHYNMNRKIEVIGNKVFIDHDGKTGGCKLFNNFPRVLTCPPNPGSFCHYKRWVELP